MADALDKFRHAAHGSVMSHVPGSVNAGHYTAFGVAQRPLRRLHLRPAMRTWERVGYAYLLRVTEDGVHGTSMALVFTCMAVLIRGRNLKPIIDAIDSETCEFIQEFDRDQWRPPIDTNAPYIESIVIEADNRFTLKTHG